ncbi:MAG TPA: DUF222 domain-containing protein [Acidimicrobiales bacterium]|nr:DUF222 domain-containing protein [Acidimicrobiales bacterium]
MADVADGGPVDLGAWLVEALVYLERREAGWLVRLAEFDSSGAWAAWGQLSCVDWMVVALGMGRSTAFDKLRVARQLRLRPVLGAAFAAGRLSYSAVRAICRAEGAEPGVDEALVAVAEAGSVADVERAVRSYRLYADQERPPSERRYGPRRGLRLRAAGEGMVRVEGFVTEAEAERLGAILGALLGEGESSAEDSIAGEQPSREGSVEEAEQSSAEDSDGDAPDGEEDWLAEYDRYADGQAQRRVDALMELVELGWSNLSRPVASSSTLLHVVVGPDGSTTLLDGRPLAPAEASVLGCDADAVVHRVDGGGGPLRLGRRRRAWSRAQRRAASVRDGGKCRFPGCARRVTRLHHLHYWAAGGRTDLDNGVLLCARHHTLVHEGGFRIAGHPNGALRFTTLDGRTVGVTRPIARTAFGGRLAAGPSGAPTPPPSRSAATEHDLVGARPG